jgi:hypothetical protein
MSWIRNTAFKLGWKQIYYKPFWDFSVHYITRNVEHLAKLVHEFKHPKSERKKIQLKIVFIFSLIKNCNLPRSKLQENPSARKREHRARQK